VRPVKSAPRSLLVNGFAVLDIEEVNTDVREPIDAPLFSRSDPDRTTQPWKPKWEKRLPKRLSVNTLDARGTSIILPIEVSTTDTSEVHSVKALLDSGAMGNFIDRDFVWTKGINTWSISRPIPVYNVDSSPNEAGRISKVVDVVLHYKTVRLANSKAGIKPTAPLSAFDKKNLIEFLLDFLHYLYNYYMVYALFSHAYHVTHHVMSCDVML